MISIVIGAYNEEERIKKSLFEIHKYFRKKLLNFEIVVVNDGSTDHTDEVLQEISLEMPELKRISYGLNKGKGFALRTGVLTSRENLVLISYADFCMPIEEVDNLTRFIDSKGYEIAIGSRALPLSNIIEKQPWWRQGMGKVFNKFVKLIVLSDFQDTQCGFKLFKGDVARQLFGELKTERFAFDVEILARAKKRGYRIAEVPVRWINSRNSKVNPVLDSFKMIKDILRIRITLSNLK